MSDRVPDWEFGMPMEGHAVDGDPGGPVVLGENGFSYRVSGKDWGNLPEGWTYKEATAVDVDSKDQVYVFNRGTSPVIVFDKGRKYRSYLGKGRYSRTRTA